MTAGQALATASHAASAQNSSVIRPDDVQFFSNPEAAFIQSISLCQSENIQGAFERISFKIHVAMMLLRHRQQRRDHLTPCPAVLRSDKLNSHFSNHLCRTRIFHRQGSK